MRESWAGTEIKAGQGAAGESPEKMASASCQEGQMPKKQLYLRFPRGGQRGQGTSADIRTEKAKRRETLAGLEGREPQKGKNTGCGRSRGLRQEG